MSARPACSRIIPAYLSLFDRAPGFTQGLRDAYLAPGSIAFGDALLLLNDRQKEVGSRK